MTQKFEDAFHDLCQMLAEKPSAQVATLGQPDQVRELPTHNAVWFKPARATFSWENGVVSSVSAPTDSARVGARPQVAPEDYDYRGVRLGMTKEQVRATWGDPTDEGRYVWTYEHKLQYITHDTGTYKADLGLGFDDEGSVICFTATLDGAPDTEFRRLMQRGHYCLSVQEFDEALRCASEAARLLDGGGGGVYIDESLVSPASIRDRAEAGIAAHASRPPMGGKSGGCFVATAAFGGSDASVLMLRTYRDRMLRQSSGGRVFIRLYERLSPPMAGLIATSARRRRVTRSLLAPCVRFAMWRLRRRP